MERLGRFEQAFPIRQQPADVVGVDQRRNGFGRNLEALGLDAENATLPLVPHARSAHGIPVPRAHLAGGERYRTQLLALQQARRGSLELGRALGDPALELVIELLELPGLAIELGEDLHLRAQDFRNHRNRNIVHGTHLVSAQSVDVGEKNGGNEDDRRLLEPRMIADHGSELEAVQLRHANIDQDDGNLVLEQLLQRLAGRRRLDQVLTEVTQNDLVAQKLGWLVVDQEDVDHILNADSSCSVFTGLAR